MWPDDFIILRKHVSKNLWLKWEIKILESYFIAKKIHSSLIGYNGWDEFKIQMNVWNKDIQRFNLIIFEFKQAFFYSEEKWYLSPHEYPDVL